MNLTRLVRHSDNQLYVGIIKAPIAKSFGPKLVEVDKFSEEELKKAILDKARILQANAYEDGEAKLTEWSGKYSGAFAFYIIDKSALKKEKDRVEREGKLDYLA
jgi:hypothetical protein